MTKITQKQLIESLQSLKEIKPNKEWVVLLKSTLLENKVPSRMTGAASAQKVSFMDSFYSLFTQRKLAYSFAAILVLAIGIFGFTKLLPSEKTSPQIASLSSSSNLMQNVADLNTKISALTKATKDSAVAVNDINAKVSALAKSLKNAPVIDSKTINEIAKTLADVPGTDLTASQDPDVTIMYQTVVKSQIADLQKTTLTDDQKITLEEVKQLYLEGKYTDALEKILLINK